jgi:protoporphyrinogen oxidase
MQVTSIDQDTRQVMLANGRSVRYDSLITTAPLDLTLMALGRSDWAARLHYSSSHIIGVGVRGAW